MSGSVECYAPGTVDLVDLMVHKPDTKHVICFFFSFVNRIEGKHFETKWGKDLERRWEMCEVSVCLLNNFIRNHICWAVISLLFWFAHLEITLFVALKHTTTRISVACHCHRRHRHRHRDHCFPLYNNLVVHFPFHVEQMKRKNQHDSRAFIAGDFNFYLLTISFNISSNCSFIVPSAFLLRSSFFSLLCLNKKSCHHIYICHTSIFIANDYSIQMTKKWRAKKKRARNRINYNWIRFELFHIFLRAHRMWNEWEIN